MFLTMSERTSSELFLCFWIICRESFQDGPASIVQVYKCPWIYICGKTVIFGYLVYARLKGHPGPAMNHT